MSQLEFGGLDLIKQFQNALVKKRVGIVEFCESDEFCGKPLYPRQRILLKLMFLEELDGYEEDVLTEWLSNEGEVEISPKIRERVEFIRDKGYNHFTTIQLIMGRRAGKGYMTGAAIAKRIYDLIQLEDPAKYFGVAKGENIYIPIVADSQDQAKKYQFKDARNWILDCKPLQEYVGQALAESISIYTPSDLQRIDALRDKRVNADKTLASLRVEAFAKNARTIRGNASIVFVFDEMAHITPGESHISDESLYEAASPSLDQFGSNAMIFANSSPYQKIGKFYELYEQSLALDPPEDGEPIFPSHFMIKAPSWEMYKDWERDHKWNKAVIFSPDADNPESYELRLKEKANPESFKVEYRAQFAEVIDAFLDPDKVDQMYNPEITLNAIGKTLENRTSGTIEYAYKAHGDPSATGANFGFAIGHVEMVQEMLDDGRIINAPHVVFDLVDAFYPEDFPDKTIDWLEILPVFANYINVFRPFEFTFDQFNSNAPIQMLQQRAQELGAWETNIFVKPGTVPQNLRRAMNFKAALNLGRVHAPHPNTSLGIRNSLELSRNELKFLQEKGGRIEKQSIGPVQTKDIADCIMEVVDVLIGESLMAEQELLSQGFQAGAQGGYSLMRDPTRVANDPFENFYAGARRPQGYNPAQGIRRERRRRW